MADKTLNTRISLKYGAIGEWTSSFKPLKGEVCFAQVTTQQKDVAGNIIDVPAVVFKVGDGTKTFGELPWASALAADVHDWAKQSKEDFDAYLTTFIGQKVEDTDNNTTYAFEIPSAGDNKGKLVITETPHILGVAGDATTTVLDFITPDELTAALSNYYTKEEADARFAPIGIDTGVHAVSLATGTNDKTLKLTVDGEVTDNIEVKNIYSKSEVDTLVQGAKDYSDENNEEYTISYDEKTQKIKLNGTNGTNSEIDATAFIKDGMISSVELVSENAEGTKGQFLKITWNADANTSVTYLDVTTLVDVYTGSEGIDIKVTVTSDKKIEATLTDTIKNTINNKKEKQTAVDNKITESAHVLSSLSQNANGDITYTVKELTPADIGAQPAGDYETAGAAQALADGQVKTNKEAIDAINNAETGILAQAKAYADANDSDTTYTAAADGGLKLTGTAFAIDESVTFILDCGGAE